MPELGDLLVLMHGARDRVGPVRAVVRTWSHLATSQEAMERRTARGGFAAYAPVATPAQEVFEGRSRVWLAPPDRVREERDDPSGTSFGVRRGSAWWRYDAYNGATSNEDAPDCDTGLGEELGRLLDPAPLIGMLDFGPISAARRAARAALHVRATPRDGHDDALFRFGAIGADELLLDVDAERGVLLRAEARLTQRPFAICEAEEIAFDETFPDDTFVFTPPPGETVRSIAADFAVRHDLTIEQAVALASFPVWVPARMPAGWECRIGFAAAQERPPLAPHVFLHYRAAGGTHAVNISESPADAPRDEEAEGPGGPWRTIDRRGRLIAVRDPVESWHAAQARVELDGTRILIRSDDVEADALADLAADLVRAPSEPPRFGA